jgi:hypothetical protein
MTTGDPAQVVFFPIRHHSPACAHALSQGFEELHPRQVLVEAPVDFEPLIGFLTDPATRPPVAIVSIPPSKADKHEQFFATYPFCAHSPELVALAWARRHDVRTALIDLPARHPDMRRHVENEESKPAPLIAEWRLDHNAYVTELCTRRGVPDVWALWDALFESQIGTADWRGFFKAVATYCKNTRDVTASAELKADGTMGREAHMAGRLARAVETGPFPIAVVTGGFHTSALIESMKHEMPAAPVSAPPANAYLIRYGFRQLDRSTGYGAGLPHPGYYDRLWRSASARSAGSLAAEILPEFSAHLRREKPALALATPTLSAALLAAEQLATLRNLMAPGRSEVIDAVRSTCVKEALETERNPLLDALHQFLAGDEIGELPVGAAQPPIVEAVRTRARALSFNLEDAAKRTRDLDILRKPRHAEASRFLYSLALLGIGFAERIAGPDPLTGWRGDALFETWRYAWSPIVESQLIARTYDGQTLEALCLAELKRRRALLEETGRGRSASAATELLLAAVRTGLATAVDRTLAWCGEAIMEDPDAASIIQALALSSGLAKPGPGAPDMASSFAPLRLQAFERLLFIFPEIVDTPEERLAPLVSSLRELAMLATGGDEVIEHRRLADQLHQAIEASPPPALAGALVAFASLIDAMDDETVAARLSALLDGAFVESGKAAAALTGFLSVAPAKIIHNASLLATTDAFLGRIDEESYLAALPELRLAFSQLAPREIDQVAERVALRHGLKTEQILDVSFPVAEVSANMTLASRLESSWREEGLANWLGLAP